MKTLENYRTVDRTSICRTEHGNPPVNVEVGIRKTGSVAIRAAGNNFDAAAMAANLAALTRACHRVG